MTPAISLRGIGKKYRIASSKSLRLREVLSFGKKQHSQDFWALQDIDLEVQPGTTLGILGRNGAGKSTLLQIISGVLQPTTGTVEVNGRLTAIFGLGSGFNPEFTGRENAMMNGLILGMDRHEMLDRFEEIEAFADIGDFIDHPVRTYSSGMKSRLGFAVAVNVEPDILVIDEALSAGDAAFKKKALQRMYELRDSGTTVLFVSHSMGMVNRFCTDAVLLHRGHLIATGTPDEMVSEYRDVLEKSQGQKGTKNAERDRQLDYTIAHEDEDDMPDSPKGAGSRESRRATGEAEVLGVELLDENREPADQISAGSDLTVRVRARYARAVEAELVRRRPARPVWDAPVRDLYRFRERFARRKVGGRGRDGGLHLRGTACPRQLRRRGHRHRGRGQAPWTERREDGLRGRRGRA